MLLKYFFFIILKFFQKVLLKNEYNSINSQYICMISYIVNFLSLIIYLILNFLYFNSI